MKNIVRLCLVVAFVSAAVMNVHAGGGITPVKLSILPGLSVPPYEVVHGVDLALLGTNVKEVQGLQVGTFYGGVDNKMVGLQYSFVNKGNDVTGVQWGFYNGANDVTGAQLGFINVTRTLNGIQLGLVNVIKKGGFLPVMVIFNASFK